MAGSIAVYGAVQYMVQCCVWRSTLYGAVQCMVQDNLLCSVVYGAVQCMVLYGLWCSVVNRPGVAGAVPQTLLSLIHSLRH